MALFQEVGLHTVRSSEGYEIEWRGREALQYRDARRRITIPVAVVLPPFLPEAEQPYRLIYLSSLRRWDTPDAEIVSDADRLFLRERIQAALRFRESPHRFC